MKKQAAFTLIELMIVIAIVSIISSVAIPQYQEYVLRTETTNALQAFRPLQLHVSEYAARFATLPPDATTLGNYSGIDTTPASFSAGKLASITIGSNGLLTGMFMSASAGVPDPIAEKTFSLSPSLAGGIVTWTAVPGTLALKYVPRMR